jgi:hypothetical protein
MYAAGYQKVTTYETTKRSHCRPRLVVKIKTFTFSASAFACDYNMQDLLGHCQGEKT